MSNPTRTRVVKEIKADLDKCIGCRACEVACSGFHASPKYSSINPARSRIRVVLDLANDVYVPIRAGDYSASECTGRQSFISDGKEYSECAFCTVSCPARDLFREPDSGLPLKCDMCEDVPPLSEPMCVQVCRVGALSYSVREVPREPEPQLGAMELALETLAERHGMDQVMEMLARMQKNGQSRG